MPITLTMPPTLIFASNLLLVTMGRIIAKIETDSQLLNCIRTPERNCVPAALCGVWPVWSKVDCVLTAP